MSLAFELALNINSVQDAMNDWMYDITQRSDPILSDPIGFVMNSLYPQNQVGHQFNPQLSQFYYYDY